MALGDDPGMDAAIAEIRAMREADKAEYARKKKVTDIAGDIQRYRGESVVMNFLEIDHYIDYRAKEAGVTRERIVEQLKKDSRER